jgi:hypothetical protein
MVRYSVFLNKSVIIGTVHNDPNSKKLINKLMSEQAYDFYLLELNKNNKKFIERNKIYFSEFYEICKSKPDKIKLIDISYTKELQNYAILKKESNYSKELLSYELDRYFFFKLCDYINTSNIDKNFLSSKLHESYFYKSHILKREEHMLNEIKRFSNYKILVVIGEYHYDYIITQLL